MGIDTSKFLDFVKNYVDEKISGGREYDFSNEHVNNFGGLNIKSKYFPSGKKCIQECFHNGNFKYYNSDGLPMQIEVPADKYEDAVRVMQKNIDGGQIHGIKHAEEIIRAGNVTYEQAKNLAKAGRINALIYDTAGEVKIVGYDGGISAAVIFATSIWNGKNFENALEDSVEMGLKMGGIALVNSQLVNLMKLADVGKGGGGLYDTAAETFASKFFRGNVVTGIATTVVMSAGDIVRIFRGRISAAQLFKNVVNTGAGVAGGIGGAIYGAAAGSVVPIVGTAIGGFVGGFIGGTAASKISHTVTDKFIEDDSKAMVQILEDEFKGVAVDYLLNEDETKKVVKKLSKKLDGDKIRDMYASSNRNEFARNLLESFTEDVVKSRKKIYLPSTHDYISGLKNVFEK